LFSVRGTPASWRAATIEHADRPRRPDGHVEAGPADLAHGRRQHRPDVAPARLDGARRELGLGEVAAAEPDRAQLEAAGSQDLAPGAHDQLGRAAADVAHEHLPVEHRHGLEHAEVDEPRLLEAGDDLDVDALGPGPVDEGRPVGRLPHGRGGHRPHGRPVDGGDLFEPDQRLDAPVHGRGGEPLHVARRRAEPHHLALALEHLDAVLVDPRHHQVDRVRADVHGRQDVRHALYSLAPAVAMRCVYCA
jgi:hypothetical protein